MKADTSRAVVSGGHMDDEEKVYWAVHDFKDSIKHCREDGHRRSYWVDLSDCLIEVSIELKTRKAHKDQP